MRRRIKDEGIILSNKNSKEADTIVKILAREHGKLICIAPGATKPKSRKRGSLEPFSFVEISAAKSKILPIITEAQLINPNSFVRNNIKKLVVAYYMAEIIDRLLEVEEKNERVYVLFKNAIGRLHRTSSLKKFRLEFCNDMLVETGFWPRGKPLSDPDKFIESVIERKLSTIRVGKKIIRG